MVENGCAFLYTVIFCIFLLFFHTSSIIIKGSVQVKLI